MTKVINLFAGPGAGKSTMASGLFYQLKMRGFNVELALEYAKDLTWEQRTHALANQVYVFGKQYHRLFRLLDKVDAIITDSPLLLCCWYGKDVTPQSFKQCVVDIFNSMDNLNYLIGRVKRYNPAGRWQTYEQAKNIDIELSKILADYKVTYLGIPGNEEGLQYITDDVIRALELKGQ